MNLLRKLFPPKKYRYRCALTGAFVSKAYAEANPATTIRERV